jgi:hypothetical protein
VRGENYFGANKDLRFYFDKVIDWDRLVPLYAEADDAAQPDATAGTWRDVLDVAGDYVGRTRVTSRSRRPWRRTCGG